MSAASSGSPEEREAMKEAAEELETIAHTLPADSRIRRFLEDSAQGWREWLEEDWPAPKLVWEKTPGVDKERFVLDAVDQGGLTIRELTERFNQVYASHDRLRNRLSRIHNSHVRPIVRRLLAKGTLERSRERLNRGPRVRYRYSGARRPLQGAIADLERAFHESPGVYDGAEG
jgi:hypothetical protein